MTVSVSLAEFAASLRRVQNLLMHTFSQRIWRQAARCSASVAFLAAGLGALAYSGESPACEGRLDAGPTLSVSRIVDGETIALDDGSEVRLIGALAPRGFDIGLRPGTWPVETATVDALRDLVHGKSVELRFDGAREDRHRRLLAHVFVLEGQQRLWVQGRLLELGRARAYSAFGSRTCLPELLAAERPAREAKLGLWAEAAYQVRQADAPDALLSYRTTFQLVEGTLARVAAVRGTVYLNFERNWRAAFSASMRRDDRHLLGDFATNPKALQGSRVRVRGWIEQRNGPVIDLTAGGAMEVLSGPDATTSK